MPRQTKRWLAWTFVLGALSITALCFLLRMMIPTVEPLTHIEQRVLALQAAQESEESASFDDHDHTVTPVQSVPGKPHLADKYTFFQHLLAQNITSNDADDIIASLESLNFFHNLQHKTLSFFLTKQPLAVRFEVRNNQSQKQCTTCHHAILTSTKVVTPRQTSWIPQFSFYDKEHIKYTYTALPAQLALTHIPRHILPPFVIKKVNNVLVDMRQHYRAGPTDTLVILLQQTMPLESIGQEKSTIAYIAYHNKHREVFALWRFKTGLFDDFLTASRLRLTPFILQKPLQHIRVSSPFGLRLHPILNIRLPHNGVDLSAIRGTPIYAAADGFISSMSSWGGYGKHIYLRHNAQYETIYGHMHAFASNLRIGDFVRQGQIIGFVGSTGIATGNHLHYEVRIHGRPVEPLRVQIKERSQYLPDQFGHFFEQTRLATRRVLQKVKRITAQ